MGCKTPICDNCRVVAPFGAGFLCKPCGRGQDRLRARGAELMAARSEASEERRFLTDDNDIDEQQHELVVYHASDGNGDWYISVLPKGHKIGPTVRIRTSGGAAATHPALPNACATLYRALDRRTRHSIEDGPVRTLSIAEVRRRAPEMAVRALAERVKELLPRDVSPAYLHAAQNEAIGATFGDATAAAWRLGR